MHYLGEIVLLLSYLAAFSNCFNLHTAPVLERCYIEPHHRVSKIEQNWIKQPLDHFDKSEKRTYDMPYFQNLELWQPNAPIYLFISGEGNQFPNWVVNHKRLLMAQMARETKGALFVAEYRAYGDGWIPDEFVSTPQSLADIANLIKKLKSDPKYKSSKVVVLGCSYAGNLAAWMRQQYPELVDAAVASSAPVLAKKELKEYMDIVAYTFTKYAPDCQKDCLTRQANKMRKIEDILKNPETRAKMIRRWNICPDSDLSLTRDQQTLLFRGFYLGSVAEFGSVNQLGWFCVLNPEKGMPILPTHECVESNFTAMNWANRRISSQIYRSCTEFGHLHTTSSKKHPFGNFAPVDFYMDICNFFVKGDVEKIMNEGIARINQMYGGLTPNVTKVVFTHGDMDPNRVAGVQKDLGPDAPATIVNGSGQCGVLCKQYNDEPKEIRANRRYIIDLIKKWIS